MKKTKTQVSLLNDAWVADYFSYLNIKGKYLKLLISGNKNIAKEAQSEYTRIFAVFFISQLRWLDERLDNEEYYIEDPSNIVSDARICEGLFKKHHKYKQSSIEEELSNDFKVIVRKTLSSETIEPNDKINNIVDFVRGEVGFKFNANVIHRFLQMEVFKDYMPDNENTNELRFIILRKK